MKKILIVYLIFSSILLGWTHSHRYTLKKDELAKVVISTTKSKGEVKYDLFFRWTLVVKDRVTILLNYKNHPYQYVLYKKRGLDRIKIVLLRDGSNKLLDKTYLFLVLSDINQGKKEVDFDIFIQDEMSRIFVDFKKKR